VPVFSDTGKPGSAAPFPLRGWRTVVMVAHQHGGARYLRQLRPDG